MVDKAKAVLLHALFVGLASLRDTDVARALAVIADEETGGPARLLGLGRPASRMMAAFHASLLFHARGQDDSYRMLTHPGAAVLPAALAEGQRRPRDGSALLAAIIAGYEVQCRLAREIVPAVQNHGFRASAVFSAVGAAVAAGRMLELGPEEMAHAIALAVANAGGPLEPSRAGSREMTYQEPLFCLSGLLAARLARAGATGAPTCLEGPAGFFFAFTGSAAGELSGSFEGATRWDPASVAADLGRRWEILDVTMKIYSAAGFNQPVIEAVARLARQYELVPERVEAIEIEMNPWETVYPSPRFPRLPPGAADFGSTPYFAAAALAAKGYPATGRRLSYGGADPPLDMPALVAELARRTRVIAAARRQYAPRITIRTVDGRSLTHEMTGEEFKWDFATERERLRALEGALPLSPDGVEALIAAVADLDVLPSVDSLVDLTLIQRGQ